MTAKYTGVARIRGFDGSASAVAQFEGRKLLALVMHDVMRGLSHVVRTQVLPGGGVLRASFDGTMPILEYTPPPAPPGKGIEQPGNIWVPRGFVVWPATDSAKFGWGFPIVSNGKGAYDIGNLAPGLDVTRWTAAGPLQDVLITAVPNAGYPSVNAPISPMMFVNNPVINRLPIPRKDGQRPDEVADQYKAEYKAYRPEVFAFTDSTNNSTGQRRIGFELLNKHRTDMALDAINLPLRGFYPIAQAYVNMCNATGAYGHYNPRFYSNYYTPGDRICHDGVPDLQGVTSANDRNFYGYTNENLLVTATEFDPLGTDPVGEDYGLVTGVTTTSPGDAFAGWLASTPHRATIENTVWNGHSSFADIGVNNFWAQDFQRRNQWLGCGNAYWISRYTEIPPLSWHAPPTRNLSYEMWPLNLDTTGVSADRVVSWPYPAGTSFEDNILWTDPHTISDIAAILITAEAPLTDINGVFWRATRNTNTTSQDYEYAQPFLTSSIFMRGRCIGVAPNGALVLGAGIQKIVGNLTTTKTKYRLQIIVHDPADNAGDVIANGGMAVAHVYHVDLDDVRGFACHSENVIKGVRGHPPTTWPWTNADDPWAWVDDGMIAVNRTPSAGANDLLRYASLWRFNDLGTEAVCLREKATLVDIKRRLYKWGLSATITASTVSTRTFTYDSTPVNLFASIGPTVALTLSYGTSGAPTLAISDPPPLATLTQIASGSFAAPEGLEGDQYLGGAAIAADYDGTTQKFIWRATAAINSSVFYDHTDGRTPISTFLAKGNYNVSTFAGFDSTAFVQDFASTWNRSILFGVVDVTDFVFAQVTYDLYEYAPWGTLPNYNNNGNCWTGRFAVESWRDGAILNKSVYTNNNFIFDSLPTCVPSTLDSAVGFIGFAQCMSAIVQPGYAKQRNGDWVFSYNVSPQPDTLQYTGGAALCAPGVPNPCWPSQGQIYGNAAFPTGNTRRTVNTDVSPIGGWMTSSFADQDGLATMMKVAGNNPRLLTVRIV
jgi:hypothetical protein